MRANSGGDGHSRGDRRRVGRGRSHRKTTTQHRGITERVHSSPNRRQRRQQAKKTSGLARRRQPTPDSALNEKHPVSRPACLSPPRKALVEEWNVVCRTTRKSQRYLWPSYHSDMTLRLSYCQARRLVLIVPEIGPAELSPPYFQDVTAEGLGKLIKVGGGQLRCEFCRFGQQVLDNLKTFRAKIQIAFGSVARLLNRAFRRVDYINIARADLYHPATDPYYG